MHSLEMQGCQRTLGKQRVHSLEIKGALSGNYGALSGNAGVPVHTLEIKGALSGN